MQIVQVVVLYIVCVVGYDKYNSLVPIVSYRQDNIRTTGHTHPTQFVPSHDLVMTINTIHSGHLFASQVAKHQHHHHKNNTRGIILS